MEYFFTFNRQLVSKLFTKFPSTFIAFCELVNNSIQANAKNIFITVDENPDTELTRTKLNKISIRDDGYGVSKSDFRDKIIEIATDVKDNGQGIGRFASFQLGARMYIETVAYDKQEDCFFRSSFPLSINDLQKEKTLNEIKLVVDHLKLSNKNDSYYYVEITDFYDESIISKERHKRVTRNLLNSNIGDALFSRYPEIIFNKTVNFYINNNPIDPQKYVIGEIEKIEKEIKDLKGKKYDFDFSFIKVNSTGHQHKVFLRVENNNLKTVAYTFDYKMDIPDPNMWFIYIDSSYFDEKVDLFRNIQITGMDQEVNHIIKELKKVIDNFFAHKYQKYRDFVKRLKEDKYYPYRDKSSSSETKQILFNQIAFYVETQHKILQENNKLRELIYLLIDKSLNRGDLQFIISELIKLDERIINKFKKLLEKADLEEVIKFCEDVASKNCFLDFLHEILYGKPSKYIKERSQLHKIIERHLWLFGEQYNNTPTLFSDKLLKNTLEELREKYFVYEPTKEDENIVDIENEELRNITDLFFFNEKRLDDESNEIMVVELKAPKVRINQKELNQIDRYTFEIEQKDVFPSNAKYKIILIGCHVSDFAKSNIGQIDPSKPFLYKKAKEKPIETFVIKWSDLIHHNRKKLTYLSNALKTKDRSAKDVFESEFSEIEIENLESILIDK